VYKLLGLNIDNIAEKFDAFDLLKIKDKKNNIDYNKIKQLLGQNKKFSEITLRETTIQNENNMIEFDAIVGNPPYQEIISNEELNSSLGKQLFPYFIMTAIKMNPDYVSLITPSRWFAGDAQDKSFVKLREFIKDNNHISKITNYINCNDVFDNVVIKGGVNYFLFEKDYLGAVAFSTIKNGETTLQIRDLFEKGMDIIISDVNDSAIINKVVSKDFIPLTKITTGRNAFDIIGKQCVVDNISDKEYKEGLVKLRCKNEEIRWIDPSVVKKNKEIFEKYKVFVSKSAGDPSKDKKIIGKPYIGEPFSACTDSLIPVGKFDTKEEANNLQKYFKTKFLRYLVGVSKVSQNVTQIVYKFVPLQNFTNDSDIDWKKRVNNIDKQLYKKYGLSENEIEFIESKIEPILE